ncbi:MAG: VWA domain-containing protein [Leptospiraceae bacterium]|nr:VWA domain-containing protein [Leptospiraceae bacterium]
MSFEIQNLHYFYALIPWTLIVVLVYIINSQALQWIRDKVSPRFQKMFSVHSVSSLKYHVVQIWFIGFLLCIAASNPIVDTEVEIPNDEEMTIVFVLDASFSMLAGDVTSGVPGYTKFRDRFHVAQEFADNLIGQFPGYSYGLITLSGKVSIQSMPTKDLGSFKNLLRNSLVHNFENTGLSFKELYREIYNFLSVIQKPFVIVFISDGEVPESMQSELYTDDLNVFKQRGIVIHTVGVGTKNPGGAINFNISYYSEEDVNDGGGSEKSDLSKRKKKITNQDNHITHETYRVSDHLEFISKSTGGKAIVVEEGDWVETLVEPIDQMKRDTKSTKKVTGKNTISYYFILTAFVLFLLESYLLYQYKPGEIWKSILRKIPLKPFQTLLIFVIFISNCSQNPKNILVAHQFNEQARSELIQKEIEKSKIDFEKSLSYGFREYIPLYNLGNLYFIQRNYTKAHDYYEQSMVIYPQFWSAFYNDGITLYEWGKNELSPEVCDLERGEKLWLQSIERFRELKKLSSLEQLKEINEKINFIATELEDLKKRGKAKCKQEKENNPKQNQNQKKDESSQDQNDGDGGKDSQNSQNKDNGDGGKDSQNSQNKDNGDGGKDSQNSQNKDNGDGGKDSQNSQNKDGGDGGKDSQNSQNKDGGDGGKDSQNSQNKDNGDGGKDSQNSQNKDGGNEGKDSQNQEGGDGGKDSQTSENNGSENEGKDPNDSGNKNGKGKKPEGAGKKKPELSDEENEKISNELNRLNEESEKSKTFKHTKHEQSNKKRTKEENIKLIKEALW